MSIRTLFCQLLIVLYVDVSENNSLLSTTSYTYLYETLDLHKTPDEWLDQQALFVEATLDDNVPKLQHWLHSFLEDSLPLRSQSAERMKLVLQAWNLVYHLIEFGYYSLAKIQHIFPVMLEVLRPKEQNSSHRRETATRYSSLDIVAEVKYRVLLILELALEIQFKYQSEILVATFADADKGQFSTSKYKKALNDFLKEYRDKSTLFTWTSPKTEWTKIIESILKKAPIPVRNLEEILLHLGMEATGVDNDDNSCDETCVWGRITSKVLLILKNHFERRSRMIQACQKALILVDERNVAKFKDVQMFMPLLSRLTASTMDKDIGKLVCAILNKFKNYCRKESDGDADQPDPIGQKILLNQGILPVILKLIQTDQMYIRTKEDASVLEMVIGYALELLQDLCKENSLLQEKLYENLELLLKVQYSPKTLAEAIKLIFKENWMICERLDTHEIEQIVHLSFRYQMVAPNFLQILKVLIQTDLSGERINARAQHVIAKMAVDFQAQHGFQVLRMSSTEKQEVLLGKHGVDLLIYFVNVTNIFSLISKDQKESVQLFCSTVYSLKEVFAILTHPEICLNVKRPFIKLLHWAFIPSRPGIIYTKSFWALMDVISDDLQKLQDRISEYGVNVIDSFDDCFYVSEDTSPSVSVASDIYYFTDAVLPFLATFSRMYTPQYKQNGKYKETYKPIVDTITVLFPKIVQFFKQQCFLDKLTSNIRTIMLSCYYGEEAISDVVRSIEDNFGQFYSSKEDEKDMNPFSQKERELNQKLKTFARNCKTLYSSKNTIEDQLGCKEKKYAKKAYTEIGSGKQLPLSSEFQQYHKAFISSEYTSIPKKYNKISILIKHLTTVAGKIDITSVDNQKLAHSALQILRAMLHNIIVILPEDILTSKKKKMKYRIRLQHLHELQDLYVSQGLVHLVMTLIGTQNQSIFRESLALLECMLFGTGTNVQNSAMDFFEGSREESLFMVISDFLNYSAELIKERRYLLYKVERQRNEQRNMHNPAKRKSRLLNIRLSSVLSSSRVGTTDVDEKTRGQQLCKAEMDLQEKTIMMNTRTVQLILKVVAKLADGCHVGLQDYLREQPDNLKSFNIIAAVTKYLGKTYMFVKGDNIELTVDIFQALAETCLGNQKNRLVVLDNKIIDYVNYILKQSSYGDCSIESVLKLKMALSNLLVSLIEESSPSALQVAKDIAQTLDIGAVVQTMETCQGLEQKLGNIAATVGHRMYIIYARMVDLLPENSDSKRMDYAEQYESVIAHYKAKVYSIEIVKDGSLQKVYFPFENAHYTRDDLKRKLKWNVDRSSPTNKIRDFMLWSNIVILDYYHQEKVLSNFMGRLIVRRRIAWDYLMLIISFLINLYMLVCWIGQDNDSSHRLYITEPQVRYDLNYLQYIQLTLEVIHNVVSLMLLCSYFLAQHPSLPRCCTRDKRLSKEVFSAADAEGIENKAQDYTTKLFSAKTAYYIMLSAMSLAGSTVTSYCFAFHLLHIVEVNTLLQGVIRAITKNGKSLLWVAILGFCVLYIYGLLGFAFFRHIFDSNSQLYCRTLYECTATVTTYGLTGLMAEMLSLHPEDNSFLMFLAWAAYQTTFFIFFSTIGLNIIFGIIVDTFSELRDLKWRAEKDMHDVCFICGLPSYDFEHHTKGFYYHTHQEHNMWAYIYYFIYLSSTNRSEYTALDYYVAEQRRRGLSDFFPVDRALSLSSLEENNEDIFAELKRDLAYLKQKQEQLDIQHHLEDQNKTQNVWCPLRVERKPKVVLKDESTQTMNEDTQDGSEPAQS